MDQNNNHVVEQGPASDHAQIALFAPIAAPILRSVDPIQVENIFKEHYRYKLEVESKQGELPSLQVTPYTASVDQSLLKHLLFMGCFDDVAPNVTFNTLTSENIEAYLKNLIKSRDQIYDPTQLREAMTGLKFPPNIRDPSALITTYCANVFERLHAIGYEHFKTGNPKHTIKLLLERVKPPALKSAMHERRKVEAGLEKKVQLFITRMREDAKVCQELGQQVSDTKKEDPPTGANSGKNRGGGGCGGSGSGGGKDKKTVCLYPPHREKCIKHFLKDCKACPKDEKEKLIRDFLEERTKSNGKAQQLRKKAAAFIKTTSQRPKSTILFPAVFGSKFRDQICADNGADGNIIGSETLHRIAAAGVDLTVEKLSHPRVFDMATGNANGVSSQLTCTKSVSIDIELHILHGSTLRLRNMKWLVTDQRVVDLLLGRPILEALGLNTRDLLAAAAYQFCGSVDADHLLASITDTGDERISTVMEGVFHADGGDDVEQEQFSSFC